MTTLQNAPGPFFEQSASLLAVLQNDGTILHANRAFAAAAANDKLQGVRLTSLLREVDRPVLDQALSTITSEGLAAFDGAIMGGEASTSGGLRFQLNRASDGTILLTAVPSSQIGAEDKLKLQCFDRILQSGPVAYWVTDAKGIYRYNDGKTGEKLGIKPGALVGVDSLEMWKESDTRDMIVRSLAGEEIHAVSSVPGLDVELWYLPIRDDAGGVTGTLGFCIDVTAQKDAERQLREQLAVVEKSNVTMQMFARVLGSTPMLLWTCDEKGTVTMCEGKGLELLGLKGEQLIGQNSIEMYKDSPDIVGSLVRALGGEETRTVTTPMPGLHFDSWFTPLFNREGKPQGAIGMSIDASERIRNERELRDKLALIQRQSATIRALATPIIRVWDEVLCLPVIGTVDSARTADMMQALLETIVRDQARFAIVDLTGVEVVDTSTADHLIQLFRAAKVLGVDSILCGIRPAVAQTVVALGLDLGSVKTMRTLRDALKWCIRARGQSFQGAPAVMGHVSLPRNPANNTAHALAARASGGEP